MVNACNSANASAAALGQKFLRKGASVFAGWDNFVNAATSDDSARFLFDRLLGANAILVESPPQRPFDYQALQSDMAKRGLDHTDAKHGPAYLLFSSASGAGEMGLLAPSIAYADPVDEANSSVTLHGSFGSQQVTVNAGAGADGKGGAPLGSCVTGGDTVKAPGQSAPPRSTVSFEARGDSDCQFECQGTLTPNGSGQPLTFSGGGSIPLVYTASAGSYCMAGGLVDVQNGLIEFSELFARALGGCALTAPDGTSVMYSPTAFTEVFTLPVKLGLDSSLNVTEPAQPLTFDVTSESYGPEELSLTWEPAAANDPPTSSTPE